MNAAGEAAGAGGPVGSAAPGRTYLDRIVPSVLHRLDERKRRLPLSDLELLVAGSAGLPRPSFADAIVAPGLSLIAEVKRASPSKGPIRPDLDVADMVSTYEAAGARAVSVVTEQDHFGGSLDDLRTAAEHTSLPLLRKDFVIDPYQVYEARAFGASAVLLIAALLDDAQVAELSGLAFHLGLDVLLEVHDAAEMNRAVAIEGAVVGINNRDLRSFDVSLDTTGRLAGLVPAGRLLVSESGIKDRAEAERLAAWGVDAILVGETLLRCRDVGAGVSALARPAVPVAARSRR
jgi:indole-3-glycerol phosphate synthase